MDLIPLRGVLFAGILAAWGATETRASSAEFETNAIYGSDNRLDYYQSPREIRQLAEAVAVVVKQSDVFVHGSSVSYDTKSLGFKESICAKDRFADQPSIGSCTAFLVTPTLVVTAGHCFQSVDDCGDSSFVFGFKMSDSHTLPTLSARNTYRCRRIVAEEYTRSVAPDFLKPRDWALIELDRPVIGRPVLKFAPPSGPALKVGDPVAVMGYPMGLPFKFAGGAQVLSVSSDREFFDSNLDSFEGNSGSPVINERGEVEGVLVRGNDDYKKEFDGTYCQTAIIYSEQGRPTDKGIKLESATSITLIRDAVKVAAAAPDTRVATSEGATEF